MSFAVDMDRRSIPGLDRMKVIDAFAVAVPQPLHTVDLTSPEKVIIVQVIRNSCTVAVMDGEVYRKIKKCNIRMCCEQAAGCEKDNQDGCEHIENKTDSAGDKEKEGKNDNVAPAPCTEPVSGNGSVGAKRKRDVEEDASQIKTTSRKSDTKSVDPD